MRTLTYATDPDGYFPLMRASAHRFGFELDVLGWGEPWRGMATKMIQYRERLRHHGPDEIVMLVDAYDVFFAAPAAEAEILFKELRLPYLLSGQRYFPASRFLRRHADQVMGLDDDGRFRRSLEAERYSRPCMGALMGYAGALVELFSELITIEGRRHTGNDQILVNLYLQDHPEAAHVDRSCRIFQNLWRTRRFRMLGRFDPRDEGAEVRILPAGRLENRFTGTHPQVIHAPMNLNIDSLLEAMGHDLDGIHRLSRSRYFRYSILPYLKIFVGQQLGAAATDG